MGEPEAETAHNPFNIATFEQHLGEVFERFQLKVKRGGVFVQVEAKMSLSSIDQYTITVQEETYTSVGHHAEKMKPFSIAVFYAFWQSFSNPADVTFADLYQGCRELENIFPSPPNLDQGGDFIKNILFTFISLLDVRMLQEEEQRGEL